MLQPTKNKTAIIFASIFVICELVIFSILNFTQVPNKIPSFCSIALCFIFLCFFDFKNQDVNLMQIALFFTVISDMFLVLLGGHQSIAMLSFSVVQITYAIRLLNYSTSKKENIINLCLRVFLTIVVEILVLAVFFKGFDWVLFISSIYATNMVLNIVFSFIHIKQNPLFPFGLILFLACDFFIAAACAAPYIDIFNIPFFVKALSLPFDLAWLFYLPSQVLICLSIFTAKKPTAFTIKK